MPGQTGAEQTERCNGCNGFYDSGSRNIPAELAGWEASARSLRSNRGRDRKKVPRATDNGCHSCPVRKSTDQT